MEIRWDYLIECHFQMKKTTILPEGQIFQPAASISNSCCGYGSTIGSLEQNPFDPNDPRKGWGYSCSSDPSRQETCNYEQHQIPTEATLLRKSAGVEKLRTSHHENQNEWKPGATKDAKERRRSEGRSANPQSQEETLTSTWEAQNQETRLEEETPPNDLGLRRAVRPLYSNPTQKPENQQQQARTYHGPQGEQQAPAQQTHHETPHEQGRAGKTEARPRWFYAFSFSPFFLVFEFLQKLHRRSFSKFTSACLKQQPI
jgi:hypothetical protein